MFSNDIEVDINGLQYTIRPLITTEINRKVKRVALPNDTSFPPTSNLQCKTIICVLETIIIYYTTLCRASFT